MEEQAVAVVQVAVAQVVEVQEVTGLLVHVQVVAGLRQLGVLEAQEVGDLGHLELSFALQVVEVVLDFLCRW